MLEMSQNCGTVNTGVFFNLSVATMDFPFYLISTGHVMATPKFFTTRTQRNAIQLIYTREGTGSISWHGTNEQLYPGSAVMIQCMDWHDYRTSSRENWVYDYIHFTGTALKNYAPYLLDSLHVLYPSEADKAMFINNFQTIQSGELRNDPLSNSRAFAMIVNMLNALMEARNLPLETSGGGNTAALVPALEYIRNHYSGDMTVEYLSELCHLSKYYFIRMFHVATGESPYQYIIKYRINKAKALLANSQLSIEAISEQVGFANYSNFSHRFKRLNNVTPGAYRNAVAVREWPRERKA